MPDPELWSLDTQIVEAPFKRSFFGNPFLVRCKDGRYALVIEEESGWAETLIVSDEFASAWRKEFEKNDLGQPSGA